MDRQATFLWMEDLLERLGDCRQQWQAEPDCDQYMSETMCRDLEELRRLCDRLRRNGSSSSARNQSLAAA